MSLETSCLSPSRPYDENFHQQLGVNFLSVYLKTLFSRGGCSTDNIVSYSLGDNLPPASLKRSPMSFPLKQGRYRIYAPLAS